MKKIVTLSITLISFFITSCDRDKIDGMKGALTAPLYLEEISLSSSTKAIVEDELILDGDMYIGVHLVSNERTKLYNIDTEPSTNNLKYSRYANVSGNHQWQELSVDQAKVTGMVDKRDAIIFAYYPYIDNVAVNTSFGATANKHKATVPVILPKKEQDSLDYDYMYHLSGDMGGFTNVSLSNNSPTLYLEHALSRVTFEFYLDKSYDRVAEAKLTRFEMSDLLAGSSSSHIKTSESTGGNMTMSILTGEITGGIKTSIVRENADVSGVRKPLRTITAKAVEGTNVAPDVIDSKSSFTLLVCPIGDKTNAPTGNIILNQIEVKFVIEDFVYKINIPACDGWFAGDNNVYKIRLSNTEVGISPVKVVDWIDEVINISPTPTP